jgi:uncharacterized DUF497 family protein
LQFDWDSPKAASNRQKHGVSFEEATEIFEPHKPVILEDKNHSEAEDRYYAIGLSTKGRVLTVCLAYRGQMIRIISARKSTKRESEIYANETRKRSQIE